MSNLRKMQRGISPYHQAVAMVKDKKQKEAIVAEKKAAHERHASIVKEGVDTITKLKENWSCLPEDPLLIGNAPESDYPENQGMGNAIGNAFKEKV